MMKDNEISHNVSKWTAFCSRFWGMTTAFASELGKKFNRLDTINAIDYAVQRREECIREIDTQIQTEQLIHDEHCPRPCGDYIPPILFLNMFTPYRTIARNKIRELIHEKRVIIGHIEFDGADLPKFKYVQRFLHDDGSFESVSTLLYRKSQLLKRKEFMNEEIMQLYMM